MPLTFSKSPHPVTQKLTQLVADKSSNLALSADVADAKSLLKLAESVADEIVILKTHIDIVSDFSVQLTQALRRLADDAGFLIFEDRKFADIGNTVCHQVKDGMYHIAQWADIINAHLLPGEGIIDGLYKGCQGRDIGLLLLAQMSSKGNLFTQAYTQKTLEAAQKHKAFVMGFIAQEKLSKDDDLVTMTPGVNFAQGGDALGQNYNTPDEVIINKKADIVIVGRGIYQSNTPKQIASDYRKAAWQSLLKRSTV